ncbi:MAG: type II secretion system F family protein [Gemmatimonadota bacterium]|nr:type II secretion system F family protein [Gemmatimonadota bacterium]
MPEFAYRAATPDGRIIRGVQEATSGPLLERQLSASGLLLLDVSTAPAARRTGRGFRSRRADVVEAVRYLATLIEAGFPLDRALGTTSRIVARRDVAQALLAARERVRSGVELATAFDEQGRIFPRLTVGMIRAGERGGHLPDALNRLAGQLEREEALRSQVLSALFYPAIVAVVGAAALLVLVLYVLPRFVAVLAEAGAALPRSTALLLATSAWLGRWWPLLLAGGVAAVFLIAAYRRSASGRLVLDELLLRVPVLGALRQRLVAARFGRSLSSLLGSGLPILPALEVAASGLSDTAASRQVRKARDDVRAGMRLAQALDQGAAFPFLFVQMVDLGEASGRLVEMLDRAAVSAERDLQQGLERLVRLVEPVMIVVFGALAGFVALSLLQAIYGFRAGGF